jgi:phospholipid-binding lipoprotein MlaA
MFRHLANACVCTLIVISSQHAIATENPDPWENVNRKIFAFNKNADTYVLKPIARGYRAATPDIVDNSITRFFDNLQQPLVIINNGLQGKGQQAASDTGRFLVNTITSLGFADVASHMGLVKHEEDFGQTFGKWGASSGAYVMLPFLGPSSVRDALAKPLDMLVNPRNLLDDASLNMALAGLQVVDTRADLIPIEKIIEGDEYLFLRDIYLQRREFLVQDGKVKDSFMDDMDDESNEAAQ